MNNPDRGPPAALLDSVLRRAAEAEARDLRQALLSFLDALDALDRLTALAATTPYWRDHLEAARTQMISAFERVGVTFFECNGQPFDPQRHEAVEMIYRQDLDDYTITEALARGCEWQGNILRCARVVVARNPERANV